MGVDRVGVPLDVPAGDARALELAEDRAVEDRAVEDRAVEDAAPKADGRRDVVALIDVVNCF